jgi:hypothetical protein
MHRFIPSPESSSSTAPVIDPAQTEAIKRWTREVLKLREDDVVTVSEVACADQGCPLVETVIVVFSSDITRSWRFTRPRAAVTRMMVAQTLVTPPCLN